MVRRARAPQGRARVYIDPYEVAVQLDRIGITDVLLREAGSRGHVERMFATPLNFPGHGEYAAASTALRAICEEGGKLPAVWHRDAYLGIPVAYNFDESIAITVTSGDEFTGIDGDRDPQTRPDKGPNTERAAHAQMLRFTRPEDAEDHGLELWYMLTYVDAERLRIELSRSSDVQGDRVTGWSKRIILAGVDLNGLGRRPVPSAPTKPIVIDPVRKSG